MTRLHATFNQQLDRVTGLERLRARLLVVWLQLIGCCGFSETPFLHPRLTKYCDALHSTNLTRLLAAQVGQQEFDVLLCSIFRDMTER